MTAPINQSMLRWQRRGVFTSLILAGYCLCGDTLSEPGAAEDMNAQLLATIDFNLDQTTAYDIQSIEIAFEARKSNYTSRSPLFESVYWRNDDIAVSMTASASNDTHFAGFANLLTNGVEDQISIGYFLNTAELPPKNPGELRSTGGSLPGKESYFLEVHVPQTGVDLIGYALSHAILTVDSMGIGREDDVTRFIAYFHIDIYGHPVP